MAKIGNIKQGVNDKQLIENLPTGTLVDWEGHICVKSWAGLSELTGHLYWSNETMHQLKMTAIVLPAGAVVEVIQQ